MVHQHRNRVGKFGGKKFRNQKPTKTLVYRCKPFIFKNFAFINTGFSKTAKSNFHPEEPLPQSWPYFSGMARKNPFAECHTPEALPTNVHSLQSFPCETWLSFLIRGKRTQILGAQIASKPGFLDCPQKVYLNTSSLRGGGGSRRGGDRCL